MRDFKPSLERLEARNAPCAARCCQMVCIHPVLIHVTVTQGPLTPVMAVVHLPCK